jgi:hypothetical protein
MEAGVFPKDQPARSIVIDGAMGELSVFHETFGYYAHGVDETTETLPDGWRQRLVAVKSEATAGAIGWCLEPNDLAFSKLAAGRDKDLMFVRSMLRHRMASAAVIRERVRDASGLSPESRSLLLARLAQLA